MNQYNCYTTTPYPYPPPDQNPYMYQTVTTVTNYVPVTQTEFATATMPIPTQIIETFTQTVTQKTADVAISTVYGAVSGFLLLLVFGIAFLLTRRKAPSNQPVLRGDAKCPSCGNNLSTGSVFCANCGASVDR